MSAIRLQEAIQAMGGYLLDGQAGEATDRLLTGVSCDSRQIAPGEFFIALRGERFDGHDFLAAAQAAGAAAAVIDGHAVQKVHAPGLPLVVVADTRHALGLLAGWRRSRFSLPLIAVTGSNGKTTTKEMIASILRAAFGNTVLATQGNFNNDIGLPLTLLRLEARHRAAVVEIGMNHPGEIVALAHLARPTVAIVTNAQRAHLSGMGSLENVAAEKGSLFGELDESGVAVINADDPWAERWRAQAAGRHIVDFAFESPPSVRGRYVGHGLESRLYLSTPAGETEVTLAAPGIHNAHNALGAAAAAWAAGLGLDAICAGLEAFGGVKGRLQRLAGPNGALLLDDTYNANPDSVRAGIDVLAAIPGHRILVLGDMGEIGDMSGQYHDEVGGYAKSQGIGRLLALGETSLLAVRNFGAGGEHFRRLESLVAALRQEMRPGTSVLVKGSHFMHMERVIEALLATPPENTGAPPENAPKKPAGYAERAERAERVERPENPQLTGEKP